MFEALLLVLAAAGPIPAVEANRSCKQPAGEELIIVCGRRGEAQRYRLEPEEAPFDPYGSMESVSRERHRLLGPSAGGIGSCSTVGPGGWTGCDIQVIKQAEQQGKRIGLGNGSKGASIGVQVGRRYVGSDGAR